MDQPHDGEPTDTRERIMVACLRVLDTHGYAGLSIGRIADEADLSKSSVYHFFDDRDDLLVSFLDYMLDRFVGPLDESFGDDPEADLWVHLDFALFGVTGDIVPPTPGGFEPGSGEPFVELRSQAVHDETYRRRFTTIDENLQARLAGIIRDGIEDGTFRAVDPEATAELLLTVMLGGLFRRATADGVDTDAVRREVERVVEATLLAD